LSKPTLFERNRIPPPEPTSKSSSNIQPLSCLRNGVEVDASKASTLQRGQGGGGQFFFKSGIPDKNNEKQKAPYRSKSSGLDKARVNLPKAATA